MKNLKYSFLIIGLLLSTQFAKAQENTTQAFPLKIAVLDESIAFPNFAFLSYSYNPALTIGTEYILTEKGNHDWHLAANIGGYYHKTWKSAIFLTTEIGYRYHLQRWNFSTHLGVGYAHTFESRPIYEPDGNGNFVQATNYGNPTFMPSAELQIGYELKNQAQSPEIYLTYRAAPELPFDYFTGLHHFVGVGFTCYPF